MLTTGMTQHISCFHVSEEMHRIWLWAQNSGDWEAPLPFKNKSMVLALKANKSNELKVPSGQGGPSFNAVPSSVPITYIVPKVQTHGELYSVLSTP